MAATIRPVRVNVDAAHDFCVDFLRLARFRNQFARGEKTIASHLKV